MHIKLHSKHKTKQLFNLFTAHRYVKFMSPNHCAESRTWSETSWAAILIKWGAGSISLPCQEQHLGNPSTKTPDLRLPAELQAVPQDMVRLQMEEAASNHKKSKSQKSICS